VKALDLFCGLGGWSDGLAEEGFEVLGVEIEPYIAELYKHPVIIQDVRELAGADFSGYDLIVGSPPCRDFSRMTDRGYTPWAVPKDPARGYELVRSFLRIVSEAEPRYWLLENVPGLAKYCVENDLPPGKPRCKARLSKTMVRCFWGNYPSFLIPKDLEKRNLRDIQGPLRKWERAKIPLPVARALGRSVKAAIEKEVSHASSLLMESWKKCDVCL